MNLRATLQPIKSLRINLTANRNYAENLSRQFFWNDSLPTPDYDFSTPPAITGNFSMSYYALPTAFSKDDKTDYSNPVFTRFLDNRQQISQILGEQNPNSSLLANGYYDGYGETQQEVLIHSFITTYSGKDAAQANTQSFLTYIPKPNWRITYDGLSKIPLFQKWFRKITIGHAYRSTLNISSFVYNLNYTQQNGKPASRDLNNNFVPKFQINTVSISEQFSPLLNVDVTMKNSLLAKIEFKRDRSISLSVRNNQITEVRGKELVIGTGYKFKNVKMPFSKKGITSNLDTRLDLSIRNNRTVIRKVVENVNQLTAGQTIFTLKFTADYIISKSLNVRLFFDKVINTPFISTTFPTSNTNAGISLRFSLSQ
jgi:cell surface protein SprA